MKLVKLTRVILAMAVLVALLGSFGAALAADGSPPRGIRLTTPYPSISIGKGVEASLEMEVTNKGPEGETVDLVIASGPKGWTARFTNWQFDVQGLYVPAGEAKLVNFKIKPAPEATAGQYTFLLKAITRDGQVESSLELIVALTAQPVATGGVRLTAAYPVVQGASGTQFEFQAEVTNETGQDLAFELTATALPRWDIAFTPRWESTRISSIRLKGGLSESLKILVTPPKDVKPGEYPLTVGARSGNIANTLELKTIVTGTFELGLHTPTGRLNTKATAGQDSYLSIWVANSGSADMEDINFLSTKPEGWVITFNPDRLDFLAAQTMREVIVTLRPPENTIAGDYAITLNAFGEQASESLNLRVAVATPTAWGWVGIGIVVVVLAGLAAMFMRLGRR